jgi:hypothetical protein
VNVATPCPCPPLEDGTSRHEQDTVIIQEPLPFVTRQALRKSITWAKESTRSFTDGELFATLDEGFLLYTIESWTYVHENDKGKIEPLPPSRDNIRAVVMTNDDLAMPIVRACNDKYQDLILLPLLAGASKSSLRSLIDGSTSAKKRTGTPQKRSKPSSTSTSQMVVTGPMPVSPGGVSNSSPSSPSVR